MAADARRSKSLLEWMFGRNRHINEKEEPEEEERLDPDRPHLPEASTTVGKGRIVLESGYTFTQKGSSFSSHAYPEALLRIGLFADWFEFRIGQNFLSQEHTLAGVRKSANEAHVDFGWEVIKTRFDLEWDAFLPSRDDRVRDRSATLCRGRIRLFLHQKF